MLETKKLGEVCKFVRGPFGGSLKKNCFVENGNAVYEQQHAIYNQFSEIRYFINDEKFEEMKRFELKSGDLIMSCSGTMGKVAIVPANIKKGIINQALLKLTPSKNLDIEYLRYWMSSPDFIQRIEENTVGAAIKNIASVKILKEIEVPVPPLQEQQQIVAILDQAFEAIDQAKANIEKNIANAKELFQSKLNAIFSQKNEDWEEKSLGEIANIQRGSSPRPKGDPKYFSKTKTKFNWITISDISSHCVNNILTRTNEWLTDEGSKKSRYVEKNEFIIAVSGSTTGKCCITGIEGYIYDGLAVIKNVNNTIEPKYLLNYMMNLYSTINNSKAGAAFPNINTAYLNNFPISIPSVNVQKTIIYQIEILNSEIEKLKKDYKQKLNNLEELKKSILQKAFTGELTNKEVAV